MYLSQFLLEVFSFIRNMIVSKQVTLHIKKNRRLIVHFIVGFHIDFIVSKWL